MSIDFQTAASQASWLQKRGQVNTALQKRYFLLHGARLAWYETEDAARHGTHKGMAIVARAGGATRADAPEMTDSMLSLAFKVESVNPDVRTIVMVRRGRRVGWAPAESQR